MTNILRHFAGALSLAIALWALALATLLQMDDVAEPEPLAFVTAIAALFLLPTLTLGLWASSSPTLPRWPRTRILLAWTIWLVPAALTVLAASRLDALVLSFLATLTLPLIVLTGLWKERRVR
jgi:hypothetical protein